MKNFALMLLVAALTQACLETRESARDNDEKQVLQRQVGTLQKSTADVNAKFQENDDEIRKLSGRIDVVENRTERNDKQFEKELASRDQKVKELSDKLTVHQEALTKMDSQITAMQNQIAHLEEEMKKAPPVATGGGSKGNDDFKVGQDFFDKKQWQDAAITFEKYRKANPKGKHAAEPLQIGVSFQEMGSKDEAKVFYKEVTNQYPGSAEAKKASTRLKSIK